MNDPAIQYVTVVCRVCGTRVDERLDESPREVVCPDCFGSVRIPGRAELPAPPSAPTPPDVGVYRLVRDEESAAEAASTGKRRAKRGAKIVLVVCPICAARLHPPLRPVGYRVRCPDCLQPVRVPSAVEAQAAEPGSRPSARPLEPVESLPLPRAAERPSPPTYLARQLSAIRREKASRPPRWTWWSDVWTFPWQPGVRGRWLALSCGFEALWLFAALFIAIALASRGQGLLGMFVFILPLSVTAMWTLTTAADAWRMVIIETAAGNREMGEWPHPGPWERLPALLAILIHIAASLLAGHAAGEVSLACGGPYLPVAAVAAGLLFPILTLSALEGGGWYMLASRPVWASLRTNPADWLTCWLLLTLAVGVPLVAWGLGMLLAPLTTALVSGPAWGTLVLISGRLLGRLGWRIGETLAENGGSDEPASDDPIARPPG